MTQSFDNSNDRDNKNTDLEVYSITKDGELVAVNSTDMFQDDKHNNTQEEPQENDLVFLFDDQDTTHNHVHDDLKEELTSLEIDQQPFTNDTELLPEHQVPQPPDPQPLLPQLTPIQEEIAAIPLQTDDPEAFAQQAFNDQDSDASFLGVEQGFADVLEDFSSPDQGHATQSMALPHAQEPSMYHHAQKDDVITHFMKFMEDYYTEELSFLSPLTNDFGGNEKTIEFLHQKLLFFIKKGEEVEEAVYRYLGVYYFKTARFYEGISMLEGRVADFESRGFFLNLLGNFYYQIEGFKEKSLKYFQQALKHSDLYSVHFALGYYYFETKHFHEAFLHLNVAEKYFHEDLCFLTVKAQCYEMMGDYESALLYYSRVEKNVDVRIVEKIALLYYRSKSWETALKYFTQNQLKFSSQQVLYKQMICVFFLGRLDEAYTLFLKILGQDNTTHEASKHEYALLLYDLFLEACRQQIYDEFSFIFFQELCNKVGKSVQEDMEECFFVEALSDLGLLRDLAEYYFKLLEYERSITCIKKILYFNKQDYAALLLLAQMWKYNPYTQEKSHKLFVELERYKYISDVAYALGEYYFEQEEYAKSIEYFQDLVILSSYTHVHHYMGRALLYLGKLKEAELYLKLSCRENPSDLSFIFELAQEFLKHNKYTDALELSLSILKLYPQNALLQDILTSASSMYLKAT